MKKTIMLFAGTTEGRRICEFLAVKKCITHVYVTTEYGKELLPGRIMCIYMSGKWMRGRCLMR